jgi:hypothetical protein
MTCAVHSPSVASQRDARCNMGGVSSASDMSHAMNYDVFFNVTQPQATHACLELGTLMALKRLERAAVVCVPMLTPVSRLQPL